MAENEYLDSTKARRWISVADALRNGCGFDELSELAQDRFYKTLRKIGQDIPLTELIASVGDLSKLNALCKTIEGATDVTCLLLDAAESKTDPVDILEQFLHSAMQNCLYDIPYLAAESGGDISLSDARRRLGEVCMRLVPDFRRIAENWVAKPSWKLQKRRNGSTTVKSPTDITKSMLSESLIAGFRK